MQQAIPSGATVVVLTQPASQNKPELYKNMKQGFSRALIGLGSVQLCIGVLCIIFQCVSLVFFSTVFSLAPVAHGIWNGLLFLITGIFGIVGGYRKSRCEVVSFNVFSVISACFTATLLGIATPSAMLARCYPLWYSRSYYYYYGITTTTAEPAYRKCWDQTNVVIAMESMLVVLAVIEGVVAIASSAVCCAIGACCCGCGGCCCCPKSLPQPQFLALEHSPQQYLQQQSPHQWVLAPNQPPHQVNVRAWDTSYQHPYAPLHDTEHTLLVQPQVQEKSDNSSFLEINYG